MNFKHKEKGSIVVLLVFVVLLLGALAFFYFRSSLKESVDKLTGGIAKSDLNLLPQSSKSPQAALSSTPAKTFSQTAEYPGTYKIQSSTNSYSVYYRGKVLKVVEDEHAWYSVSFQPQDDKGSNLGSVASFALPKYPPKNNASTLGLNFKQMIDKGLNPVDINITYDTNGEFLSWDSLK